MLEAARDVLERSGWWGFKVRSVLRQADLSTRSFYRHFDSKSDLLVALLQRELGSAAERLRRVTAAAETPSAQIRVYLTAMVDTAYDPQTAKQSSLFAVHWRELLPGHSDTINSCMTHLVQPLMDAVAAGAASGEVSSTVPSADAWAIFYLVAGMTADQAASRVPMPRAEFENIITPFVERAIGLVPN
ncbi:MAG: TetR/AcrR family transcriptional regulator [Nocardia sp.]|nr:TetR/AcrR family transcriptional regulator [Nocardia sp.]